ncbi:periplasmic carboxy-terminal processing protease lipoprotein [Desulfuromonas soudanensis]|uniref:Periplasmic carboxy-terminal processing protease lipoprotein n=1 Tax=Desulfuromonas soudanensis TaxID=1603606 RepID=A0A0M4D4B0_9BACT|nr:carboxy terminal-processing peptidase [Desulfuromonas soudanensis]ALC18184.1 periplasmic carboxy-terminal processing protease lipoprotein [Desulfuromonas soudanensis]
MSLFRLKPFRLKSLWLPALLLALLLSIGAASGLATPDAYDASRAKLLGYVLKEQLTRHHYSHKALDDDLSQAAFGLYLNQLDGQKRFLLQKDVVRLQGYAKKIDDEISKGTIELPRVGAEIMARRIAVVRTLVEELLAGDFDFAKAETLETDPEKIEFCANDAELKERWRKTLKYQFISRFLSLQEDEVPKEGEKAPSVAELRKKAKEKVLKNQLEFLDRLERETEQDHLDRYFNAVTRAYDPHTNYLPPTEKEDFDISMKGSLEGIGATLQEEDGYIKVVRVIPGSAAARQGQLHAEDLILQVAQGTEEPVDVTDTRLRDAVTLIRGPKDSEVRLTVKKPDGTRLVIPIIRDVVQIDETFVKSTTLTDPKGKTLGYIRIPSFYRDFQDSGHGGTGRNSTDDMRRELEKLAGQKIDGLIVDLRNNGGGALTDAVSIAGLFIKEGPVVQVRSSYGEMKVLADEDPSISYSGPLVVLVNQFSASASEILAGALQDYGRALVLGGDHTHGKGTVQAVIDLDRMVPFRNMDKYKPLGALKVTIQKFYRVSGDSTQYRGVVPDIVLPDRLKHLKSGEQYIDYSLPWDKVEGTNYSRWPKIGATIEELRAGSAARVSADKEFSAISEEARVAKERMDQSQQSLQIDDLRREREEARRLESEGKGLVSPHGAVPAAGDKEESTVDSADAWIDELAEDPYVLEAQSVLDDMQTPRSGSAVAGQR